MAEYIIPTEIKEKLTDEFYSTMWQVLIGVFGDRIKGFHEDVPKLWYISGTGGWCDALGKACDALGLNDVLEHYNNLEWYDSDQFDGIIETELAKRFSRKTNADRIRAMSDEELANFLCYLQIAYDLQNPLMMLEWLRKECDDRR